MTTKNDKRLNEIEEKLDKLIKDFEIYSEYDPEDDIFANTNILEVAVTETDKERGKKYEWSEPAPEEMSWFDAKKWCEEQGEGWRMPKRWELIRAQENGAFKNEEFDNYAFWSATDYSATIAWTVSLYNGYTYYNSKSTFSTQVRCVRECN